MQPDFVLDIECYVYIFSGAAVVVQAIGNLFE
jgi:hypothetical protein